MSPKIRQQTERRGEGGRRKHVRRGKETQYGVALVPGSRDDSTERMQRRKRKKAKEKKRGGGYESAKYRYTRGGAEETDNNDITVKRDGRAV